jgi:4-nitrophenyl phosphatase
MTLDLTTIRALILDMDGVLWRGAQPIGNLPAIFEGIRRLNWGVVLATNNCTATIAQFQEKLAGFGVNIEASQIINSGQVTGRYLKRKFPQGGPVFTVGEPALDTLLSESGFVPSDGSDALAVVAGMDRGLTYQKLTHATLLIRAGCLFIGTNPDRTFPIPEGLAPGAGAVLAALEAATDIKPVIMGKPMPEIFHACLERLGTSIHETLAVGDRLETDIAGAQAVGCRSALTLSGVTSSQQAAAWSPAPDWVGRDLTALVEQALEHNSFRYRS